jgi:hypothetical protein
MSIMKNFRLDPWIVRTLKELQKLSKDSSEKNTIVAIIATKAKTIGALFGPCPDMKSLQKSEDGLMVQCSKKNKLILFDPNCLECQTWKPTAAQGDG